jgi:hypothetical protein
MDIPTLEAAVRTLEHSIGVFTWCLLGSTFVVSLGLILEYWHPVSEFIEELRWPMSIFRWPKFMEIAGGILVTIGVLGEFGFTLEVFVLEGRLEQANHAIRDTLTAKLGEADQMAKTALSDSSTALSQATDALTKAGKAQESLGKAEDEANRAQTASSNALTLARGARQEADSFEKDIASAKEAAAEAKEKLADRTLTDEQLRSIGAKLKTYSGQQYHVLAYWDSKESKSIAERIHIALQIASWTFVPYKDWNGLMAGLVGINVWVHTNADEPTKAAASALVAALLHEGIQAELRLEPATNTKTNMVSLNVGSKR